MEDYRKFTFGVYTIQCTIKMCLFFGPGNDYKRFGSGNGSSSATNVVVVVVVVVLVVSNKAFFIFVKLRIQTGDNIIHTVAP